MTFKKESDFEEALIKLLTDSCGWEKEILRYKTEKELIQNWADILFQNNRSRDRLNDYPLTEDEMQQIIDQLETLRTPQRINNFINGRTVSIKRTNQDDKEHCGKEVSLKIYDRQEIAAGQSRYQIAQQPIFATNSKMLPDRRGDFMLLINGMPVIHVELKKSNTPISQACWQIEKYSHEQVFTGFFSLVQVFIAMNPEDAVYFANPGFEGKFNRDFYFHWADFNNEPVSDWQTLAKMLMSIPMAHQLIGFYTIPDSNDGILKVMRSYQYYAANKISDTVAKHDWESKDQLGGYIWHTTGSGKTMTSFKSALLIADSKDADKVVFLLDRIELGTQSAAQYRGFAPENVDIKETEDTVDLIAKLKSNNPADTLIVTSVQKMSNINEEDSALKQADLDAIRKKRVVFIVDECHRSTFGEMMQVIKKTFTNALFFGFTGTPIQIENYRKGCTTADVFGNELHRYSIADGIRDKNVLGFDPDKVLTFKESDSREKVALDLADAATVSEVFDDPVKTKIFYECMNNTPMAGYTDDATGKYIKGIEDYLLARGQYRTEEHQKMVVKDILENMLTVSHAYKFHGIFATSSIPEAIEYYHRFKAEAPDLHVTALFDPSIDNTEFAIKKEDALSEIITDYNGLYGQKFTIPTWDKMKKDIQFRLSHSDLYKHIEHDRTKQLDLLIVVDQMLTGYDSKWVNVLYLDKILRYENIIQAFSRTNRLYGPEKPFGCIRYYRAPFTMERNINAAIKLYSGDKPFGMFAIKLDKNLENMNACYTQIKNIFESAGIANFERLPDDTAECKEFARQFNTFNKYLEAAKVQGFLWDKLTYDFTDGETQSTKAVTLLLDEKTYKILALRYKELFTQRPGGPVEDNPYDLQGYLTTIDTDEIDADFMNSRFEKFRKALNGGKPEDIEKARQELHNTFATLSQEEQKFANLFLHDIQTGDITVEPGKSLRDYINDYMHHAKNDQISNLSSVLDVDEDQLRYMMTLKLTDANINEYGRLDNLKKTVDKAKAKAYFEAVEGEKLSPPKVTIKVDRLLRDFIIKGGFDIPMP